MNEHIAGQEELPRTAYLDHTLRRARTAAEQRSHRYVTLEHLLLALLDDPDAGRLLQMTGADVAVIHSTVADAVNNRMASLVVPDGRQASFSYRFDSLFQCANEDARGMGRREVDGALALIAIAKDAESNASGILAANGFNPQAALELMKKPPPAQRAPQTAPKPVKSAPKPEVAARNPKGDQKPANGNASRPPGSSQAANLTARRRKHGGYDCERSHDFGGRGIKGARAFSKGCACASLRTARERKWRSIEVRRARRRTASALGAEDRTIAARKASLTRCFPYKRIF